MNWKGNVVGTESLFLNLTLLLMLVPGVDFNPEEKSSYRPFTYFSAVSEVKDGTSCVGRQRVPIEGQTAPFSTYIKAGSNNILNVIHMEDIVR